MADVAGRWRCGAICKLRLAILRNGRARVAEAEARDSDRNHFTEGEAYLVEKGGTFSLRWSRVGNRKFRRTDYGWQNLEAVSGIRTEVVGIPASKADCSEPAGRTRTSGRLSGRFQIAKWTSLHAR